MIDLTQEEWKESLKNSKEAIILDVRTEEEFEEGYIPNAILADIQNPASFMSKMNELEKSKDYYIYCRSGGRSTQACQIMKQMGFENTHNLLGGFSEWEGEKVE